MSSEKLFDLIPRLASSRIWLFLDYDGTLAGFAPTPDEVRPDEDLIALLGRLSRFPNRLRLVILSGRRLEQVRRLAPLDGVYLGGTYGVEMVGPDLPTEGGGENDARPALEQLKSEWMALVKGRIGFFVEDKGRALALHGKNAIGEGVEEVFLRARQAAERAAAQTPFRLMGGQRFLEVAPVDAGKGNAVAALLERDPFPRAELVYFGDDDKDEEAFAVVAERGGVPALVAGEERPTAAHYRLSSPDEVRRWLKTLAAELERTAGISAQDGQRLIDPR